MNITGPILERVGPTAAAGLAIGLCPRCKTWRMVPASSSPPTCPICSQAEASNETNS
jgi:hypothetical protein